MSGSRWWAWEKTGRPETIERSWKTLCFGVEDETPSEDRMFKYSERSFLISPGTVWR